MGLFGPFHFTAARARATGDLSTDAGEEVTGSHVALAFNRKL